MLSRLANAPKVVGAKQTKRAAADGRAAEIFLARDADPRVTEPFELLCLQQGIPVERDISMKELGKACGIAVGAAVAALLKE